MDISTIDRVFVVFGACGEYSDYREWPVRAFVSEAEAGAFLAACEAHIAAAPEDYYSSAWNRHVAQGPDPSASSSYTGTTYSMQTVPLGATSTALETRPPQIRHRGRELDLTTE